MHKFVNKTLKAFRKDENGATAIEYGLIAALIAVVLILSLTLTGNALSNTFSNIADEVEAASN